MLKKGRLVAAATFLMVLAGLLAACGSSIPILVVKTYDYHSPTSKGGTLLFSDWQAPDTLNPLFAGLVVDQEIIGGLWGNPVVVTSGANYIPDQLTEVPNLRNG